MPPKAVSMPPQPGPVQDTLGINTAFMLPTQGAQFQKTLQLLNDLQSRKAKEPNNPQIDVALSAARAEAQQIIQAVNANERQYKTPEAFKQYAQAQQARSAASVTTAAAAAAAAAAATPAITTEKLRSFQVSVTALQNRIKEIDAKVGKTEGEEKNKLLQERAQRAQQVEHINTLFRAVSGGKPPPSSTTTSQDSQSGSGGSQPSTPTLSQPPTSTPGIRNGATPVTSQSISQGGPQATLPAPASIGPIARPAPSTGIPSVPRPTLTGGYPVGNPLLGTASPITVPQAFHVTQDGDARLLSKRKLQDLVKSIDPDERLEPDVEELLMEVADEFIDSVLQQSCKIARHRRGQMLEVKDVQLHLERNWNIRIPGYAAEDVRTVKKYNPTAAHTARIAAVNQAKAMQKD